MEIFGRKHYLVLKYTTIAAHFKQDVQLTRITVELKYIFIIVNGHDSNIFSRL